MRFLNNQNVKDIVWILYAVSLGTFGNILYRINNDLKIKPFLYRLLYGIMATGLYVGGFVILFKDKPKLQITIMLLIFIIAYFTEIIIEVIETELPDVIKRLINKAIGENTSLKNKDMEGKKDE